MARRVLCEQGFPYPARFSPYEPHAAQKNSRGAGSPTFHTARWSESSAPLRSIDRCAHPPLRPLQSDFDRISGARVTSDLQYI